MPRKMTPYADMDQHSTADRDEAINEKLARGSAGLAGSQRAEEMGVAYDQQQQWLRSRVEESLARVQEDDPRQDLDQFRQKLLENKLKPSLIPQINLGPDQHVYWASTNDPQHILDCINMGYQYVRVEECPEFREMIHYRSFSNAWQGIIATNELICLKIPKAKYDIIMRHNHHDVPVNRERAELERVRNLAAVDGLESRLLKGEGDLIKTINKPAPQTWQ